MSQHLLPRRLTTPPILVFGYGNPSRGDDALGPLFLDRAAERFAQRIADGELELLGDFQLQVEHALDLADRVCVLFVDASLSCAEPYALEQILPARDTSFTSHSLTPAALLHVFEQTASCLAPRSLVLGIRGYRFELGEALSARAALNLETALAWADEWLAAPKLP